MTGGADDSPDWRRHFRSKDKRRKLVNRFKDAKDPFRIVIVRDIWLTGFAAPCLHTMYADKPMQGHGFIRQLVSKAMTTEGPAIDVLTAAEFPVLSGAVKDTSKQAIFWAVVFISARVEFL